MIDALGLSEQFASTEAFLAALEDIELIRSELSQTNSDLTLTFNRLASAENGIAQMFSYFQFGEDDGAPYLDMGSSASSVKMRLTNTRLSFVQAGTELAYFSDNKLYVMRMEGRADFHRHQRQWVSGHGHDADRCWLQMARVRRWRYGNFFRNSQ